MQHACSMPSSGACEDAQCHILCLDGAEPSGLWHAQRYVDSAGHPHRSQYVRQAALSGCIFVAPCAFSTDCVCPGADYLQAGCARMVHICDSCASHVVHICHSCTYHRCMCMADHVCALVSQSTGRLRLRGMYQSVLRDDIAKKHECRGVVSIGHNALQ